MLKWAFFFFCGFNDVLTHYVAHLCHEPLLHHDDGDDDGGVSYDLLHLR